MEIYTDGSVPALVTSSTLLNRTVSAALRDTTLVDGLIDHSHVRVRTEVKKLLYTDGSEEVKMLLL